MQVRTRDIFAVYWRHIRPYIGLSLLVSGGSFFAVVVQIATPWIYKLFIDVAVGDLVPVRGTVEENLVLLLVAAAILGMLGNIFWRVAGMANSLLLPRVSRDLENSSYAYLLQHSYRFFTNAFAGSLVRKVRRLSRSVHTIMDVFHWHVIGLVVGIGGALVVISLRSGWMALAMAGWFAVFVLINVIFSRWKLVFDEKRATLDSKVTGVLADGITNSQNIQLFAARDYELKQFATVTERFRRLQTMTWQLVDMSFTIQGVLIAALEFGVMYWGFVLWQQGILTIGDFALLQGYIFMLTRKVWDVGRYIRDVYEALADATEMVEVLNTPHEIQDIRNASLLEVTQGKVEFEHVGFAYNKTRTVLDDFTLSIEGHEKIALVGPSGAGKSTTVKLLLRYFDLHEGRIFIDGQDISTVTQDSLRAQIALVPQEPILFHRTLMENIRYGRREATDQEVIEAAKRARCHEFIQQLPHGYDTLVGERGIKLSGGERQRVAIARAMLKDAPILVLDEATSSLDSASEALIQEALDALMKEKTTIVIAHRLSTILQMDRIVVVKDGRVIDQGTHDVLLEKGGLYANLWNIQAGGFLQEEV